MKMRIGLLSDSHGVLQAALSACEGMGEVEEILHAGDYYQDGMDLGAVISRKVRAVTGNCDRSGKGPTEEIISFGPWKVFLTHGHGYGVKHGTDALRKRAKALRINVVVFGHTHIPTVFLQDNILFINPGSCSRPRGGGIASFGVLHLQEDMVEGEIFNLQGERIMHKCKRNSKQ